jgi:hypothetical protein
MCAKVVGPEFDQTLKHGDGFLVSRKSQENESKAIIWVDVVRIECDCGPKRLLRFTVVPDFRLRPSDSSLSLSVFGFALVASSGIEPELSALRGRRVNQLHHDATVG